MNTQEKRNTHELDCNLTAITMSESGEPETAAELRAIAARSISKRLKKYIRDEDSRYMARTIALFKSVLSEVSSLLPVLLGHCAGGARGTGATLYVRLR